MTRTIARPHNLSNIPRGLGGVRATLSMMSKLVNYSKKNPAIREAALNIVRDLPQKDYKNEVVKIHAFVRDHIRYVKDVKGVETLQYPLNTLEIGQGDCDDKSTLAASLLESIGHPTRFIAVGFRPNSCSHVYLQTKIGQKWVGFETTEPVPLGWEPSNVITRLVRHN